MKNVTMGRLGGFTLIELLVVVLIIGILAAIALPQYQRVKTKAEVMQVYLVLRDILKAEKMYHLANGTYTRDIRDLDIVVKNGAWAGDFAGWRFTIFNKTDVQMYEWGFVYTNWLDLYEIRVYYSGAPTTCTPRGQNAPAVATYACDVFLKAWNGTN